MRVGAPDTPNNTPNPRKSVDFINVPFNVDSLSCPQVSEGLVFLHSGVKMVHGNLCLENIILNKSGAWKIMGFDHSISSANPSEAEVGLVLG